MKYCAQCAKQLDDGIRFCPYCKAPQSIQNQIDTIPHPQNPVVNKIPSYVVLQVVLKEKLVGTGSKNLMQIQNIINQQAAKGYRLHTISTTSSGSVGLGGGDRIQATMVFESL